MITLIKQRKEMSFLFLKLSKVFDTMIEAHFLCSYSSKSQTIIFPNSRGTFTSLVRESNESWRDFIGFQTFFFFFLAGGGLFPSHNSVLSGRPDSNIGRNFVLFVNPLSDLWKISIDFYGSVKRKHLSCKPKRKFILFLTHEETHINM